jgi:hypothetical protein
MQAAQRGAFLLLATLVLMFAIGLVFAIELAAPASRASRERATAQALAEAREALLAYAADRPVNAIVGPGYLPCPDLDNDGWAESTCGSLSGDSGQQERLGRLPWKTLGIADLRDGDGERLWYAVSSRYKGLLNCAASAACVDMSPAVALGTITVRAASGALLHDGTVAEPYRAAEGGAVAVVIAPGAPLGSQSRNCAAGDCLRAANYLEGDNAAFVDRNDAAGRPRNADGFTQGPGVRADGSLAVNDRLTALGYRDVMPRIMRRVALEAAACLRSWATAHAAYPAPVPLCGQAMVPGAWTGVEGARFGRIADTAWDGACTLSAPASHSWWKAWRVGVFYAVQPGAIDIVDAQGRATRRARDAAVIVAGAPLVIDGFVQQRDASALADARQWLEGGNALLESGAGCGAQPPPFSCEAAGTCARVTDAAAGRAFNDVVVALP